MKIRFNSTWLLPFLSGVFIGTSYIPFYPWALLFCFVPLWLFWFKQTNLKSVLIGGFITAFVLTLIAFNWFVYLLHDFVGLSWVMSWVGMLVFALLAHLFLPLAGGLWFLGQRKFKWSMPLSLSLLAIITAICEAYSYTLFDWNFGYSWYGANFPVYNLAEFIGFKGLSALTLLLNLPLLIAWQKRNQVTGKITAVLVLGGFLLLNVVGLWIKGQQSPPDASLHTLMIQKNVDKYKKLSIELGRGVGNEILQRYLAQTDAAVKSNKNNKIDFLLWPETAFPGFLGEQFKYDSKTIALSEFLKERQLPLLTGALGMSDDKRFLTNSLFVFDKNGELVEPHYSKSILLAYGEYLPFESFFPKIRNWLPKAGNFARGTGSTRLLNWNGYRIGVQICYESLFPDFSRGLANLGAQFIVNASNDSWFGSSQEPYQHLYMALARSVEFRRPVLRVANTGISSVALASGEILERSPIHQEWNGLYEIPYVKNPQSTFYQRYFWLTSALLWVVLVLLLLLGFKKPVKNQ